MLTLALDTATGVCTVGLVQDGHVLAEYDISVGLTHSEGLMPQLDQMFARTGIKKEEIDRIAVSIGMADRETLLQQLQRCGKPVLIMGECEKLLKQELPDGILAAPEPMRLPKASSVALAAEGRKVLTGEDVFTLRPYYIRKSEAEELWEKNHKND